MQKPVMQSPKYINLKKKNQVQNSLWYVAICV